MQLAVGSRARHRPPRLRRTSPPARTAAFAALVLSFASAACQQPSVGERLSGATFTEGPKLAVEEVWIDLHGHAVATFSLAQDEVPLTLEEVTALAPRFTLAKLTDHPADGQRAWESLILTGAQVAPTLQPGGPDDPEVLTSVRQPGSETGSLVALGEGRFRYVFANAVTGFDANDTLRVGMWLSGVENPSLRTSSTYDFRPSGGPVEVRDTVLDANCAACHGTVVAHETVAGVRLCLTCHTWQNVDTYTIDPAALVSAATTAKTNPNPLELGRMLHRIHRGKDLPTIYQSAWDPAGPSTVPSATGLPAPFTQQKAGFPVRNPLPGRKYSIVRADGHEVMFAQALVLATVDPSLAGTMLLAAGGLFPRDLRDCDVCHGDAPQGSVVKLGISRRTCSGCHPEVWFQASSPSVDRSRFPHPGGPQADDAQCLGCHVTGTPKLYAPIEEAHVPPARAPRYDEPIVEIVGVEDLAPGKQPKVTFKLYDRVGPIVPTPSAPVPAFEPSWASSSYVPRKFAAGSITIKIVGPTTPDYSSFTSVQLVSGSAGGNPDPATLSTTNVTGTYVYMFTSVVPAGTVGTFIVGMEARRTVTLSHYDKVNDVFRWPFTGEPVNETAENAYVYVNSASGVWPPPAGSPAPVPRRTVVELQKCLRCHDRIEFHSGNRHDVAWCVTCHTADETDLDKRINVAGRRYPGGPVKIGATFDGVEERSTHFKTMMHRIHTGARKGAASLDGIAPYAVYFGKAIFFDRGRFPGDLRNCTLCHAGKSYLLDSIPVDAPSTRANEQATIWHPDGKAAHDPNEPALLPIQAACLGCHATGTTYAHAEAKTVNGVETCAQCHAKGALSVDVAHGLARATGTVASTFTSIVEEVLVPRCATSACHAAGGTPPLLEAAGAYAALVGVQSGQSSLAYVEPGAPEASYLVQKLRGTASSVGGSVGTTMPPDGALAPADLAAIEAWIANGAPND